MVAKDSTPAADKTPDAPRPEIGDYCRYRSHDAYHPFGPRDRDQLILVTGYSETGNPLGKPLGWLDDGAEFAAGQLGPLKVPDDAPPGDAPPGAETDAAATEAADRQEFLAWKASRTAGPSALDVPPGPLVPPGGSDGAPPS
jgi:hypothetical protein